MIRMRSKPFWAIVPTLLLFSCTLPPAYEPLEALDPLPTAPETTLAEPADGDDSAIVNPQGDETTDESANPAPSPEPTEATESVEPTATETIIVEPTITEESATEEVVDSSTPEPTELPTETAEAESDTESTEADDSEGPPSASPTVDLASVTQEPANSETEDEDAPLPPVAVATNTPTATPTPIPTQPPPILTPDVLVTSTPILPTNTPLPTATLAPGQFPATSTPVP